MKAGELYIELSANMARLSADMAQAKNSVQGAMAAIDKSVAVAKGALIGLGVLGIAASMANNVRAVIDLADSLNKLSQRTGLSTETLSQWQYAAKLADVDTQTFSTGVKKLNIAIAEGLAGDKQKIALFQALGITQKDLGKGTESVMMQMADAFAVSKDGAGKTAVAVGLLGKAGDEMIPLLNGGSDAVKALKAEADKLGLTISTDFAKQAEEFNDNLTRINASGQKLAVTMAGDVVSGLGKAVKAMADAAVESGKIAGIIAFLQTALTGDDRHKNNVEMAQLVETTEKLAKAEKLLAEARSGGPVMANRVIVLQGEVDRLKERIKLTQSYKKLMDETDAKVEESAKKAEAAKTKTIKAPNTEAATEYDALLKRIQERIDLTTEELVHGRALTEQEKFEAKALLDLAAMKKTATAAQREAIETRLADSKTAADALELQRSAVKEAEAMAAERTKQRQDEAAAIKAYEQEQTALALSQHKIAKDTLEALEFEAKALEMTTAEREIAIAMRQLELQGIKEGTAAYAKFAESIKAAVAAQAERRKNPDNGVRDAIREYNEDLANGAEAAKNAVTRSLHGIEDAMVDMMMTGKLNTKSLVDMMLSEFYRLQVVRPLMAQLLGTGGAQSGLMSLFGSAGSIGGLLSTIKYSGTSTDVTAANYENSFDMMATPLASGMPYVPYDNFPAMLHKGERVLTAAENAQGGGSVVNNYTFNGGVSRGEVMAGLSAVRGMARSDRVEDQRRGRA